MYEILFYAALFIYCLLAIFFSGIRHRVHTPKRIPSEEIADFLAKEMKQRHTEIQRIGFNFVGVYDCSEEQGQDVQVAFYFGKNTESELAIMGIKNQEGQIFLVPEFSSMLEPHGELCTNMNKNFSPFSETKDIFVMKMPWVKTIEDLYKHHLEHLSFLEEARFRPKILHPENIDKRLLIQSFRDYENQVRSGRFKKLDDGSYRSTLKGVLLGTPLLILQFFTPMAGLFVGRRSTASRRRKLWRQARAAQSMPNNNVMTEIPT